MNLNNKIMREILFRGKSIVHGEWVEGNYFHNFRKGESHSVIPFNSNIWYEVHLETVGQFTGLTDKNGKKIFEGDILKDGNNNNFIVQWDECGWSIGNSWLYKTVSERKTIIGNIHDNPELIK